MVLLPRSRPSLLTSVLAAFWFSCQESAGFVPRIRHFFPIIKYLTAPDSASETLFCNALHHHQQQQQAQAVEGWLCQPNLSQRII
jgi:hypothetical protein